MEYGTGFLDYSKASRIEMMSKSLAPLMEYDVINGERSKKFSTLFCPAGFEFYD